MRTNNIYNIYGMLNYLEFIQNTIIELFIKIKIVWYLLLGFLLSFVLIFIWYKMGLFKEKIHEFIPHHNHKKNTITSTGMVFLFSLLILIDKIIGKPMKILIIVSLISMIIGIIDDVKKMKTGNGLSRLTHIVGCILIGAIPIHYNFALGKTHIQSKLFYLDLGILYIPFMICVFIGTINGANFSDGINGSLAIITLIILLFLLKYIYNIDAQNSMQILLFLAILIGTLCSFLIFNLKGKVFMGNCGSIFLGTIISTIATLYKIEILIPIFCIWFVSNVLSVIINIISIKYFQKRIFKMSPLHHHFELLGYSESKICCIIFTITIIFCYLAFNLI